MDENKPIEENITEENNSLENQEPVETTETVETVEAVEDAEVTEEKENTISAGDDKPDINNVVMPDPKDYGWHPAQTAQPSYQQTSAPNYMPPYPPYPPYYQYATMQPPRRKMKGGTKAFFIIVISLLSVLVVATTTYAAYKIINYKPDNSQNSIFSGFDYNYGYDYGYDFNFGEDTPDKNEDDFLPDLSENQVDEIERPEITPNTDGIQLNDTPKTAEKSAKDIYASIKNSIVGVVVTSQGEVASQGSGIIATTDGYIITNAHVVLNKRTVDVTIVMNDETEYKAMVVGFDKTTDLAVLKIYNTNDKFVPVEFGNSDELAVGEWVLAIGNPGGQDFASSLTRGIVSAVNRKVGSNSAKGMTYIQTDAAINPGNSGGALVNMHGQVIGINSSKIVASGYEGMGFSIPISKAKAIIDELMATGYVEGRTRLGISGIDISDSQVSLYKVPHGFQIASIDEDGAFAGTEAQVGDIITAMDGETVTGLDDITAFLAQHKAGDYVTVTLYRYGNGMNSETLTVEICLLEDKGETQG